MSAKWSATAICDRDQILAMLRDALEPMTAKEIGSQLAYTVVLSCRGEFCRARLHAGEGIEHIAEGFDRWTNPGRPGSQVTPDLVALVTIGLVTREKRGRSVIWSATLDDLVPLSGLPDLGVSA